jgi:hypothetical protein
MVSCGLASWSGTEPLEVLRMSVFQFLVALYWAGLAAGPWL